MSSRAERSQDWHILCVSTIEMSDMWPQIAFGFADTTDIYSAPCCLPFRLCLDWKKKKNAWRTIHLKLNILRTELNQLQSDGYIMSKPILKWSSPTITTTTTKRIILKKVNSIALCGKGLKCLPRKISAPKKNLQSRSLGKPASSCYFHMSQNH